MAGTKSTIMDRATEDVAHAREQFYEMYLRNPIPDNEVLSNLGLFMRSHALKRVLFMHELYKKIINIHGSVLEFGVRWGQNLSLFHSFRDIYEPYNTNRKIVGFDTFEGFPSVDAKDGGDQLVKEGSYTVTEQYQDYLEGVLNYHQSEAPAPHLKRFELVQGDASITLAEYLKNNPETIVAFAYFDFDIYEPTKKCLELLGDRLTKGSVIGFDELNLHEFPGETLAFEEVLGIKNYSIQRLPFSGAQSFIVIE